MYSEKFAVIGAGPSGSYVARLLSDKGYDVKVFDMSRKLGAKPCGWGLPYTVERVLRLPEEVLLAKVRGFRVFVDFKLAADASGRRVLGYIVDKPRLIRYLLEGVEKVLGKKPGREDLERRTPIFARGHPHYPGSKINALQVVARGSWDWGSVEAYFFSDLIGYAWVFPLSESRAKVGVGGEAGWSRLKEYLYLLIKKLGVNEVSRIEGSPIASGGLVEARGLRVGEEIGAVMPLTGEGIRPGFLTAKVAFDSIEGGRDYYSGVRRSVLAFQIKVQKAILSILRRSSPEERKRLLLSVPEDLIVKITAGDFTLKDILALAVKHPRLASVLARMGVKV